MILDLHKLHVFLTVAQHQHFTRAAEALHMAQPSVSQQISMLESALGVQLIDRSTRHFHLTEAGQTLLHYAERLSLLATEAQQAVQVQAGAMRETLKLGVGHTLATYLLPGVLSDYRSQYPQYRVRLTVGNTTVLLSKTASGEIDLALVGSPAEHPDLEVEPFMHDRLVVIVGLQDSWMDRGSVSVAELRERVFLTREPGSALYASVAQIVGQEMLNRDDTILLGETEAIKRSVELGLGVALIQQIAIEREQQQGTLHAIHLSDGDDRRTYLVASRKQYRHMPAATSFMEILTAASRSRKLA
ncbi:MAG: LysR family transcriptional regulator [Chloroflexota bacterium]|nr:LysR family transcriptional regulator [Chloroflexota bacterium]